MKRAVKYIFMGAGAMLMIFAITFIPYLAALLQDRNLINKQVSLPEAPLAITTEAKDTGMTLPDKISMAKAPGEGVRLVELKMGREFSLYEARKECQEQLGMLPLLKMDLYGPVREDIHIRPVLYIDIDTPAYTMVVWIGEIQIEGATYEIKLEEESRRLLSVTCIDGDQSGDIARDLEVEWNKYISS
jgi:hypothetical protein